MTTFWDMAPCSLVEVDRRFRNEYCLHHHPPDYAGSTHLWNVRLRQRHYTVLCPRKLSSSYSLPWGHDISHSTRDCLPGTKAAGVWTLFLSCSERRDLESFELPPRLHSFIVWSVEVLRERSKASWHVSTAEELDVERQRETSCWPVAMVTYGKTSRNSL
jgi:hypothetical protein